MYPPIIASIGWVGGRSLFKVQGIIELWRMLMSAIKFTSIPTSEAAGYWNGGLDAYGKLPERHISDGSGIPCRHCQQDVAKEDIYLILAHCPFPNLHAYAETGPIFLHVQACQRYPEIAKTPDMFLKRDRFLLKGYSKDDRIVYGTGQIVQSAEVDEKAADILTRDDVSYVHVRSALNNCFSCRIDRV